MSAFGLLTSPLGFETVQSRRVALDELDADAFCGKFASSDATRSSRFLREAGVPPSDDRHAPRLDMRYVGQGYEIEVPLPSGADTGELLRGCRALFADRYAEVFGISFDDQPLEIVNWKVEAQGPIPVPATELPARKPARPRRRRVKAPAAGLFAGDRRLSSTARSTTATRSSPARRIDGPGADRGARVDLRARRRRPCAVDERLNLVVDGNGGLQP